MKETTMKPITLTNTHVCSYGNGQEDRDYVIYTGTLAGVSDRAELKSVDGAELELKRNSERLNSGSDEVKLDRE